MKWLDIFDTSGFIPRWSCGDWSQGQGWVNIFADLGIWSAYMAIPVVLAYYLVRRREVPFPRVMWLFVAFIFACGTTHLIEAALFWWPAYRLAGVLKLGTAVVSWAAVVVLVPTVPKALALPRLAMVNADLEREIEERRRAQDQLRQLNESLEERVAVRTEALHDHQRRLRALASEMDVARQRERRRISKELHDHLAQMLSLSRMRLGLLQAGESNPQVVEQISQTLEQAIDFTRSLMSDLSPPLLDDLGLKEALEWLGRKMEKNHKLRVQVEDDGQPKPLSEQARTLLFETAREVLFNVIKHARTDRAKIELEREGDAIRMTISDSGCGFDVRQVQQEPTDRGGFGLFSVRERALVLGGKVQIDSAPGQGTRVVMEVLLTAEGTAE